MTTQFLDNLLGLSNSLTVVERAIAITRQGNGNFAITVFSVFKDGKRGQNQIGFNYASLSDARSFAAEQAPSYGGCRVVVAPSALAA